MEPFQYFAEATEAILDPSLATAAHATHTLPESTQPELDATHPLHQLALFEFPSSSAPRSALDASRGTLHSALHLLQLSLEEWLRGFAASPGVAVLPRLMECLSKESGNFGDFGVTDFLCAPDRPSGSSAESIFTCL